MAGFAAVGALLGPGAEQASRDIDDPERKDSDCDRIFTALEDAGIPEGEQAKVADALDRRVRNALALPHVGDMVEEIAIRLGDHGGALGPVVKAAVQGHREKHQRETVEYGNPFQ